jgi:hypothetical protein
LYGQKTNIFEVFDSFILGLTIECVGEFKVLLDFFKFVHPPNAACRAAKEEAKIAFTSS